MKQTWKLYKRSKIGLTGLVIMLGFVFVAVFAPFIAPFDPQYAAPNEDVFVANFVNRPLDGTGTSMVIDAPNETWHQPIPIYGESPNYDLRVIMSYSSEGHAVKYNVEVVTSDEVVMGIDLWQPSAYDIPPDTSFMEYVYFGGNPFFVAVANDTYYELGLGDFSVLREDDITFVPTYLSNVWWINRTLAVADDNFCFAMANSSTVFMIAKSMPKTMFNEPERFFYDWLNISHPADDQIELEIIGNPIVIVDKLIDYGKVLLVPTDKTLIAYEIDVNETYSRTNWVRIGDPIWHRDYEDLEIEFDTTIKPVEKYTIAVENEDPT
ncbi:MAG: hypothetical protein KAW09_00355, partial [Thermoplasmata archaeon]|nr:hypothetical protein [Thermoplasmata archaeon]